jgi:hypothetical protein
MLVPSSSSVRFLCATSTKLTTCRTSETQYLTFKCARDYCHVFVTEPLIGELVPLVSESGDTKRFGSACSRAR